MSHLEPRTVGPLKVRYDLNSSCYVISPKKKNDQVFIPVNSEGVLHDFCVSVSLNQHKRKPIFTDKVTNALKDHGIEI